MVYILIKEKPNFSIYYNWALCGETPEAMRLIWFKEYYDNKYYDNKYGKYDKKQLYARLCHRNSVDIDTLIERDVYWANLSNNQDTFEISIDKSDVRNINGNENIESIDIFDDKEALDLIIAMEW